MKYRPEIDGLRALAEVPVIFVNAGFDEILYKDRTFFIKNCINNLVEKSNKIYNKLYFVGNKNFGNNLNWIVRKKKKKITT